MAEEKKTVATPKVPAPVKPQSSEPIRGAWVVMQDRIVICVESSELKGARVAIRAKADLVFWPFGKSLAEVTS